MNISKIFNRIETQVEKHKLNKKITEINNYVKLHDVNTYGDSFNQMYNAREVMANYAKKKGVSIDIYDAKKLLEDDESISPAIANNFSDKINLIVTNILNGKSQSKIVSANTDKTFPKVREKKVMIPISEDGTERIGITISKTEDSFIRNLYRNIEYLTNSVTAKNSK